MTTRDRLKVLYVLGFARSGTTVLGNLLGEMDGFFHLGELHRLWLRLAYDRGKCGCHEKLSECPFWSEVLSRNLPELRTEEVVDDTPNGGVKVSMRPAIPLFRTVLELRDRATSGSRWPSVGLSRNGGPEIRLYAELVEKVLQDVAEDTGATVLVDSSKSPEFGGLFRYMETISPYFLHIVRDPRGSVLSRQRRHARLDGSRICLDPKTATADCVRWVKSNLASHALGRGEMKRRYISIRYEDFITNPTSTLKRIAGLVGETPASLPLRDERSAYLGPNHTVGGNRNRFKRGEVRLKVDDRWRKALRRRDYVLITSLTAPLLVKYGYSVRAR